MTYLPFNTAQGCFEFVGERHRLLTSGTFPFPQESGEKFAHGKKVRSVPAVAGMAGLVENSRARTVVGFYNPIDLSLKPPGSVAMAEESSFDELLERLQAGHEDAARQIFQEYAARLIGLARTHLNSSIRRKVDPEDVVQSVLKSFFVRMRDGQFELENRDSLWGLLVVITLRKCGHKVRELHRQRQDIRKEAAPAPAGDDSGSGWQAIAREPTPAEAAILAETVEVLFGELKEREREIVELYLQGVSIAEIQAQVRRSEYTVRDVLNRLRRRLERQSDGTEF
jgi:RNA polymerase sigma-70 factor, ECF subfamily